MSGMAVVASLGRSSQLVRSHHHRTTKIAQRFQAACQPSMNAPQACRIALGSCPSHPMQPAFQTVVSLHNDVLGPLEKTTPSGEFTAAMLAFTVYNLCRNPTFSRVMVSAAFMAWPRLVTYLCKERPALRNLGMQLFNAVLVRNNPVGIVAGIAACWLAHKCTVFLPPQMHQGVRTAAFLGAMVGGARCYAS